MKNRIISIAGNIGIGKSTLTSMLSKQLGWKPYFEVVDTNPYLSDFYKDMNQWSFHLQVYFLSQRFKHQKEMMNQEGIVVQDRSIYEDVEIFAKNLYLQRKFNNRDYENYKELFSTMTDYLKPPDVLVYLRASVGTLIKRIAQRGRNFEMSIPKEYLEQLNCHYDEWIEYYREGKRLVIDTENLDIVHKSADFEYVSSLIQNSL
ncbi:MAG: deoxynucleoside kinase [Deltaproteobacteria bacterium]|nr:deoxynucleoside kinase [Deltaproteobacteria bacterium]